MIQDKDGNGQFFVELCSDCHFEIHKRTATVQPRIESRVSPQSRRYLDRPSIKISRVSIPPHAGRQVGLHDFGKGDKRFFGEVLRIVGVQIFIAEFSRKINAAVAGRSLLRSRLFSSRNL